MAPSSSKSTCLSSFSSAYSHVPRRGFMWESMPVASHNGGAGPRCNDMGLHAHATLLADTRVVVSAVQKKPLLSASRRTLWSTSSRTSTPPSTSRPSPTMSCDHTYVPTDIHLPAIVPHLETLHMRKDPASSANIMSWENSGTGPPSSCQYGSRRTWSP